MRRLLWALLCALSWALLAVSGLLLWAAASYCRDVPALYSFFGAEALEEQMAKGIVWVAVQGFGFLLSAALCLTVTRAAWKRRRNPVEKRQSHENTASDRERY